jgi:CRP/FNR family transcriptional regulator, cyclic AMP receptor protein
MLSPNGLGMIEDCLSCHFRTEHTLCGLSPITRQSFERIKVGSIYPKGAVLFMQGQSPRGVFVLCKGRVKLSICAGDGKTFIVRVAQPAELLGLSATMN